MFDMLLRVRLETPPGNPPSQPADYFDEARRLLIGAVLRAHGGHGANVVDVELVDVDAAAHAETSSEPGPSMIDVIDGAVITSKSWIGLPVHGDVDFGCFQKPAGACHRWAVYAYPGELLGHVDHHGTEADARKIAADRWPDTDVELRLLCTCGVPRPSGREGAENTCLGCGGVIRRSRRRVQARKVVVTGPCGLPHTGRTEASDDAPRVVCSLCATRCWEDSTTTCPAQGLRDLVEQPR